MDRTDLERIRKLNDKIQRGLLHIEYLRSKAYPGAIQYDDTGGSTPTVFDSLGDLYAEIDKVERKVNGYIDERYRLKAHALTAIQAVTDDEAARDIMYMRYLDTDPMTGECYEWDEVIYRIGKVHKIHRAKIYQIHHDVLTKLKTYNI